MSISSWKKQATHVKALLKSKQKCTMTFAREKPVFKAVECVGAGTECVNGKYSIKDQRNGSFVFVNNNNINIIMVQAYNTWELLDSDSNTVYYKVCGSVYDDIAPKRGWEIVNGKLPVVTLDYYDIIAVPPSKPRIIRIKSISNGAQIYFECDEAMRRPNECPHIAVWYEIQIRHYKYDNTVGRRTKFTFHGGTVVNKTTNFIFINGAGEANINGKYISFFSNIHIIFQHIENKDVQIMQKKISGQSSQQWEIVDIKLQKVYYFVKGGQTYPPCVGWRRKFGKAPIPKLRISNASEMKSVKAKQSPHVVNELINGDYYEFVVKTCNHISSTSSTVSPAVTPLALPPKPTIINITGKPGELHVHFDCPNAKSKEHQATFEIIITPIIDEHKLLIENSNKPVGLRNLANGKQYKIVVASVNGVGVTYSKPEIVYPSLMPSKPPRIIKVEAKSGQIIVHFNCDGYDEPAVKAWFEIEFMSSVDNFSSVQYNHETNTTNVYVPDFRKNHRYFNSPIIFTRIKDGVSYKVRVKVVTLSGYQVSEFSESIIPKGIPPIPKIKTLKALNASIEIGFGCNYECTEQFKPTFEIESMPHTTRINSIKSSPYIFCNLVNGQKYKFRICSTNIEGTSKWSQFSHIVAPNALQIDKTEEKSQNNQQIIDFDLFNSTSTECDPAISIETCQYTKRVLSALMYYQSLCSKKHNEQNTEQELIPFCTQIYQSLLNDYIHIISHDNLDALYDFVCSFDFKHCDFNNCKLLRRHFSRRFRQKDQKNTDMLLRFWTDIMDSIHCYFFHLYDLGLRTKQNKVIEVKDDDNETKTKLSTKMFENIEKFSINITTETMNEITWIDSLNDYLCTEGIDNVELQKLNVFIHCEEYDTESLKYSLLHKTINWETRAEHMMMQYARYSQLSTSSFSNGLCFFYWPYYKKYRGELEDELSWNVNDYSGYGQHELYVEQKYQNIKEELFTNNVHPFRCDLFLSVLEKATTLIQTQKAKKSMADVSVIDILHCEIRTGTALAVENMIAVILYTDHSDLSTAFSSTFRRNKSHETLASIKKRNREFWNWAKTLRETVQYWGDNRWNNGNDNGVTGPFYCGMSFQMLIPQFNIRLCGPTSTSVHFEIAEHFGGEVGIVMHLNNISDESSKWLRCFNCSWISCYTEEEERLFMGGDFAMAIETVTVKKIKQDFSAVFKSLYYFDCMINGTKMELGFKAPKKCSRILNNLIKHKLQTNGYKNKYNDYIND
eukprot:110906_1